MKKKISLMIVLVLIMQIILPMLTVICENSFTLISKAVNQYECTDSNGITWTYALDSNDNAISVRPKDKNTLPTEVTIPKLLDGHLVTRIGREAFSSNKIVTNINIPESLIEIEQWAFRNCSSLINVTVDSNNNNYSSKDGVLFNKNETTLVYYPNGKTDAKYSIPEGVTCIVDYAFEYSNKVEIIEVPSSVKYIFTEFNRCESLKDINVSEENQFYYSIDGVLFKRGDGDFIFLYCYPRNKTTNTSYTIPEGVRSLWSYAFDSCKLTNIVIPNSVTHISDRVFEDCGNLTNITMSENVNHIGVYAFAGCSNLTNIEIPKNVTVCDTGIFSRM